MAEILQITPEEAYLEELYAEEEDEFSEPILLNSQVIRQSKERPTYHEHANSVNLISTLGPKATVSVAHGSSSRSPLRSASHGMHHAEERAAVELQRELEHVIQNCEVRRKAWEEAMLEAAKAQELVRTMDTELRSLHDEEAELLTRQPPAPERLKRVRTWAAERAHTLEQQREMADERRDAAVAAEAALRSAEADLDMMADLHQEVEEVVHAEAAARADTLAALADRETRAGLGYVRALHRTAEAIEAAHEEQRDLVERRTVAAEEAQAAARERLKKGLERVNRNVAKGAAVAAAQNESRRNAVMGLKSSLKAVREEVASKAALYRQLQKQRREVREREFQDLIEQGLNPYEVYRKRDIEQQVTRQRAAVRDRIAERQEAIATQLAREEVTFQRQLAVKEKEKQTIERFQHETGRVAQEQRVDTYMRSHTVGGLAMLDPTGRLPVDPSAVTTFKTKRFGSGQDTDMSVLAQLAARHPDATPKQLLVPAKYRPKQGGPGSNDSDDTLDDDDDDDFDPTEGDTVPPLTERSGYTTTRSATGTNGGPGSAAGGAGWKVLETRALSKFEKGALEAAKSRHKESIGKAKKMMGQEFGGDAFMSTPAVVVFKDFEVGHSYSCKVAITNRSYAKNTFRVVQVPPEYGNVLEVFYKLPGYLATGVSTEVTLTFTPKANEDIETFVELLAETGPFKIPVKCTMKKAALVVSPPEVDFGPGVILGETATRTFTIANEGALDVEYAVDVDDVQLCSVPSADGQLAVAPFTVVNAVGTVKGYGKTAVTVHFKPDVAQASSMNLCISYKSIAQRKLFIPPHEVKLKAVGRDVPIFLERSVIDFNCVMVDHVYRDYLVVRNGGKTAMKVSVANRPDVDEFFEFSPNFGFAQAGESFQITVLFKPRSSILQKCARFVVDEERGVLEIPMKVTVPDQKLPVLFTLRAAVTTTDLTFSPPSLDFGPCIMNEGTGIRLAVTNPSALPQTFGFVNLPAGISIKPNDGFGYVLPGESVERIVTFQPPIPGPQTLSITARTLAGRTFSLPATAVGVAPTLSLSHNRIAFPATPLNDVTSVSVVLKNNTDKPQAFEFGVPPESELSFIPHVGSVPAGGTLRVQVDYAPLPDGTEPPFDALQVPDPPMGPGSRIGSAVPILGEPRMSGAGGPGDGSGSRPGTRGSQASDREGPAALQRPGGLRPGSGRGDDAPRGGGRGGKRDQDPDPPGSMPRPWYRWRQFSVPCSIRPPAAAGGGGTSIEEGTAAGGAPTSRGGTQGGAANDAASEAGGAASVASMPLGGQAGGAGEDAESTGGIQQLHLNIVTCAVLPDLRLRSDLAWNTGKRCYELNFGPVPVGQRVTRHVELVNAGEEPLPLNSEPLDHRETFSVVNALRVIPPGGRFKCLLSFTPLQRTDYLQVLTITCPTCRVRIALKGQGIAPELRLEPEGLTGQGLDLGDVPKGESREAKFSVTNVCPFPLSFAMRLRGVPDPNVRMQPAFFCRPAEGTLAQGECCEVTVVFRPHTSRPYFEDVLQVYVPNQQEQLLVPLKGRCWEEGVFITGPQYPDMCEDPFMELQLARMAAAAAAAGDPAVLAAGVPPPEAAQQQPAASGASGLPLHGEMAPWEAAVRELVLTFPHPMCLGEAATASIEVGSLKSASGAGAAGEFILDELPAAAREAGWSIDPTRTPVAAGEKKPVTVRYQAPKDAHAGMAAYFGLPEHIELRIGATLKGGLPAPPTAEGRRALLLFRVLLQPRKRSDSELVPPSITSASAVEEAAAAGQGKGGAQKPGGKK